MTTTENWSKEWVVAPLAEHTRRQRVYGLAKELFVSHGGNKPPHRCINDAMLFDEEWMTFCGMTAESTEPRYEPESA